MKVKELLKTVNVAWSPQAQYPILLATGTAAQQLDASFSTSASLDLYSLNLEEPGYDMKLCASIPSDHRFHKIIWGAFGNNPAGMIVGGCDYGTIKIYSAGKMLSNDQNCLISSPERHKGPVRALDFNPFQTNLLATGATESEIYIWDLNNTSKPMTPGAKSVPPEDVQHIAWNKQVQHILASTFQQRCVILDLRKNEAIIKLSDPNSKVRWKVVQWHPEVATQLCLASEEDQAPIIQLWDLRFATSPLKTLQSHQRGVLSIAWCPHDADLLLSCAKDNKIICWNPNSDMANGEVSCEFGQTNQWNFDVSWCPRHPGLFVGSSFDGHAAVYSLLGGYHQESMETTNKIVDSFPGMDPFTQPLPSKAIEPTAVLRKAPKWLKRPVRASFAFGGKLVVFDNSPPDPSMPPMKKVYVSQVIINPDLINRSRELETALSGGQFSDFCKNKANSSNDEHAQKVWDCIGAYFANDFTKELLELLGFNIDEMNNKLNQYVPRSEVDNITEGVSRLNNALNGNTLDGSAAFDAIAEQEQRKSVTPTKMSKPLDTNYKLNVSNDETGLITQAILLGNIEAAVALCFNSKKYTDAIILSMAGGSDLLAQTMYRYFSEHKGALNSLMNSVVSKNWMEIVKNCDVDCWKEVLVGIFTHCSIEERNTLCDTLGNRLAISGNQILKKNSQICYICSGNLNKVIEYLEADIQETVELVTIMEKALEYQWSKKIQIDGKVASVLTRYAEMLAAEGDLDIALKYLGNSQEPRIKMLRDRLNIALGYVKPEFQRLDSRSSQVHSRHNQHRGSFSTPQNTFTPVQPSMATHNWNSAPIKQPFTPMANQGYGVVTNQPFANSAGPYSPTIPATPGHGQESYGHYQTPVTPSIPPPPPSSATPNLGNSRPPSVGPHSRSKYLIDPSVKSSPYGQPSFSSPNQMPNLQQSFNNTGMSSMQSPYQTNTQSPYSAYPAASPMYNPAEQEYSQKITSQPTLLTPTPTRPLGYESTPPQLAQMPPIQQTYESETSYQPPSNEPSGWNDPPINTSTKPQQKSGYQRQDPVRSPISTNYTRPDVNILQPNQNFQSPQYQHQQHQQPQQQQQQPQQQQSQQFSQHQQQSYSNQADYNQYNQQFPAQQFNRQAENLPQPAQAEKPAEPEKPKAPIPAEHISIQNTFNSLKDSCLANAKNPQMRKKIDDVSRKLESLYDCLRDPKLSQNTLQGLHQICDSIQNGDYQGGLAIHTQLVSGPDFSQIASFMPGIKVLLQCALQLGVYLR